MTTATKDRSIKHTHISVHGARMHNLKNVNVAIPRGKFVVFTGVSGSGKSSLVFDTLYAEGQRRYVESLSAYARQFLGRLDKPEVDSIKGISPAIAIEQKVTSSNPRSTVGTTTEIYDYMKLLFARIGKTYSPKSGKIVKRHREEDVLDYISGLQEGSRLYLVSPLPRVKGRSTEKQLEVLLQQGFTRILVDGEMMDIEDLLNEKGKPKGTIELLIDRFIAEPGNQDNESRILDSAQTAFYEGDGYCSVVHADEKKRKEFSNRFELDGQTFEEPSVHFFSFNNPVGACKTCEGFGSVIGIDEDLVIPNKNLSVFEDAIVCWNGQKMSKWKRELTRNAHKFDFPVHTPIKDLTPEEYDLLWTGNEYFKGINKFFRYVERKSYKIQYRVMLSRYRGKTPCHECNGTRLRGDARWVKVDGHNIIDLVLMPVDELYGVFRKMKLGKHDAEVAKRLLTEITNRLSYLVEVGLGYLTLNRVANTLSGGESQRIQLSTSLGSTLVGSMYILDEPSIGLHPRDTNRLIDVLKNLRDSGNTVIVVEHEEEMIRAADELIDMGPLAGTHGGEVVFQGDHDKLRKEKDSLTAQYLTGKLNIPVPEKRRSWKRSIKILGAAEHNLQDIDVEFPLDVLTVVTGVSGSGKSTLVSKILYPGLKKLIGGYGDKTGKHRAIEGDTRHITNIEFVDQNPIGKSSRSNPVTYVKAFDEVRGLFSKLQASKINGFKPKHFSFNVPGGRCDNCEGEGTITVEMQFMADVELVCDICKGQKFKDDVLDVRFEGKNIYDVLELTVDDAIEFFSKHSEKESDNPGKIVRKLRPLQEVGLGYVTLGQSSNTLSGGEAQRIKLASFLSKGRTSARSLFIFDEPTTGLHFHDIHNLLKALNGLIENGHSVLIIEHNGEIIKNADWVIDLGPEGGNEGGDVVFTGIPENLVKCKKSYTGKYLKSKLSAD